MFRRLMLSFVALFSFVIAGATYAAPPETKNGVTTIHLEQYNGYFSAKETLAGLKAGTYEIVVTNLSGKAAGFQVQAIQGQKQLDMFPLDPGETRTARIKVGADGFRYRCPINPTPWYDVDTIK
jgi:hypothetical protein